MNMKKMIFPVVIAGLLGGASLFAAEIGVGDRERKETADVMRCGVCRDEIAADRTKFGAACRHWFHAACMKSGTPLAKDVKPFHKAIDEAEECSVCLENLKDRSVISNPSIGSGASKLCGHSFCAKCSHKLIDTKECPECRERTTLGRYRFQTGAGADTGIRQDKAKIKAEIKRAIDGELIRTESAERACPLCRGLAAFPGVLKSEAPKAEAPRPVAVPKDIRPEVEMKQKAAAAVEVPRIEVPRAAPVPVVPARAALELSKEEIEKAAKEMDDEDAVVVEALHCIECEQLITPEQAARVLPVLKCYVASHFVHDACVRQFVQNGMCMECNRSLSNSEEAGFSRRFGCPEVVQKKRQEEIVRRGDLRAITTFRNERDRLERMSEDRKKRKALVGLNPEDARIKQLLNDFGCRSEELPAILDYPSIDALKDAIRAGRI